MIDTLVIQITNRCPYHCSQCYMQKGDVDIPLQDVLHYIDELLPEGLAAVQLTGGEPIIYSNLCELIKYTHDKGVYAFLATSGYQHSIELYRALFESGLDIICVSINDIDQSINRLTRDAYEESFMAIKEAIEVGLICYANVVVSDQNIRNFAVLAHYLKHLGVVRIDVLRPVGSFDGNYIPCISKQTIQQLNEIVMMDPEFFRVENCFKEYWEYSIQKTFVCKDVGNSEVFLNVDGTVSPCSKLQCYRYSSINEMLEKKKLWKGGCCR